MTVSSTGGIIPLSPSEKEIHRVVAVVRQLVEGRSNATIIGTLASNVASTKIVAPNCSPASAIHESPTTAHAAVEKATGNLFYLASTGLFWVNHTSNSVTDRTFIFTCLG